MSAYFTLFLVFFAVFDLKIYFYFLMFLLETDVCIINQ